MKIGILGTGTVGQTLAAKLSQLKHDVWMGTRDTVKTLARTEPDAYGNPPVRAWLAQHPAVKLATLTEAASHGEVLINATTGQASLQALQQAGASALRGKILMDLANPLDFSRGAPPSLAISNTDSLGEQIQRAFPETKVVKTLNTLTAGLMVNPQLVQNGDHHIFVSGNDPLAKQTVIQYLKTWFGWKEVLDLGDITTARGTEMWLALWVRLWGVFQTPLFNLKLVRQGS